MSNLQENIEYLREKLDFKIYRLLSGNILGFYDSPRKLFFYYDTNKIKLCTMVVNENEIQSLFESYFCVGATVVDINAYFSKVQKIIRLFDISINVTQLTKSLRLGFPRIKQTLFNNGELNNVKVIKHTLLKFSSNLEVLTKIIPLPIINHIKAKSERTNPNTSKKINILYDYLIDLEDPELLVKDFPIFFKCYIPKYASSPILFHIDDIKFNNFNSRGYNPPKERTIVEGIYCRVIRTAKKYHNFNLDDIILVQKILVNSKTPQCNKALCSLNNNPKKQGLVKLTDLKRM